MVQNVNQADQQRIAEQQRIAAQQRIDRMNADQQRIDRINATEAMVRLQHTQQLRIQEQCNKFLQNFKDIQALWAQPRLLQIATPQEQIIFRGTLVSIIQTELAFRSRVVVAFEQHRAITQTIQNYSVTTVPRLAHMNQEEVQLITDEQTERVRNMVEPLRIEQILLINAFQLVIDQQEAFKTVLQNIILLRRG